MGTKLRKETRRAWRITAAIGALAFSSASASAEPPPLAAYGDLPAVEAMALSPNQTLAIISRLQGARTLLVADASGNIKKQTDVGDMKLRGLKFAGDDLVLVTTSKTASLGPMFAAQIYEFFGSLIVPLSEEKPRLVFSNATEIWNMISGEYGIRQVDNKTKGYFSGITLTKSPTGPTFDHGRPTLFEVDLARNSALRIAMPASEGHRRNWLIDGNGRIAATLDKEEKTGRWKILGYGESELVSGVNPSGDIYLQFLGKDGNSVVYLRRDDQGISRYYEVSLHGGEPNEIFTDIDISRFLVDKKNGHLMGYVLSGEIQKPVLFDPKEQQAANKIFKAFSQYRTALIDWTPDFTHVIVRTSGNGDSGTYYLVDVANLRAQDIGIERPLIHAKDVGPISLVPYKAADGLEMNGVLTLPANREARNLPVILLPHEGPHSHDVVDFDWWAQAYASRGYAVFQPNFRGSTNQDDTFRNAAANEWGRKMQTDISDGLAELARQGIVDPKRACIVGAGYGGYAALAGVTLQQGIYRCAVAVAPVADLDLLFKTEVQESGRSGLVSNAMKRDLGDPKGYDAVSPRRHANRANAPILLIHGKDDTVVSYNHSTSMASALRAANKPVQLIPLKREDHWLSGGDTRLQMLEESMRFIQQHNPAE